MAQGSPAAAGESAAPPRRSASAAAILAERCAAAVPGPGSYEHAQVVTSERRHRTLADGVGVSQRFHKGPRFPRPRPAERAPGPQKYRPSSSFCSRPLAF